MTVYKYRWYWCDVEDGFTASVVEPDWSRVPEVKRDVVQAKWQEANVKTEKGRWQLWGPQIQWYMNQRQYKITVIGEA